MSSTPEGTDLMEARGTILDTSLLPAHERIAFFTSLCRLRSGTILCGFQIGPKKHAATSTIGLCRTVDEGATWSRVSTNFATTMNGVPGELGAAELIEVDPGRLLLFSTWFDRSEPDRPLFDPETEGILKSKQLLAVSTDDGHNWSEWKEISTGDLKGCAMTGPCLRWPDGTVGFLFESFKEFDDPNPGRHAAWMMMTQDGGETFSTPMLVAQHPQHQVYYWDQRLCVGPDPGGWTALFWTHDLVNKRDLNVHLRHGRVELVAGCAIMILQPIQATGIPGQIAAPLFLRDGRLVAFVVDRDRPGTMTLWVSSDEGRSWPDRHRHVIHVHEERAALSQGRDNINFKQYWEDMGKWSFGHPAVVTLDNGDLLLAWYAGQPDCMGLHWARVSV